MDKAVFRNHLTSDSRRSSDQNDKITFSHKVEQEHVSERKLKGYTDQAGRRERFPRRKVAIWCTGTTLRDGMGREEGGGFRMGNTGIPVADSF